MWSTKMFPTRVMFGPYGGEILPILGQEKSSGYAWQVGVVTILPTKSDSGILCLQLLSKITNVYTSLELT